MSDYIVHAKRAKKYWELHIEGVGVTQSRNLGADADDMIRSYVAMTCDVTADSVTFNIVPEFGGELDAEVAEARRAARKAEQAVTEAAARSRAAARHLREAGLTGRDAAVVLGVSPQRISQLLGS